jgi:hypothetical protein
LSARSGIRSIAGIVFAMLLFGCSEAPPTDPAAVEIIHIGDRIYTLEEFQGYLADNLVAEDDLAGPGNEAAMVKSRLFDAFVDERLLLLEADLQGLQVSDLEVEAYLGISAGAGESSTTRSDWNEARHRLKIEKLLEQRVRELPPTDDPSSSHAADASDRGRRLRLRSLMLETPELAAKVSREIVRGRISFDEAVVSHATSPEHGMPVELAWGSLSEEHRQGLEGLKEGQVSKPLEIGGVSYLFQIEAWLSEDSHNPEALAQEARRKAESLRRAEVLRTLVTQLREKVRIKLFFKSLPFVYVPDDSVD